jgi:RNA polymerase sigma factor (sigma-70 family)
VDAAIYQDRPHWGTDPRTLEQYVTDAFITYGGEVSAHLRSLLRDGGDAEDLNQEAFLRLHREAAAGRRPDNVRAWLHRVAVNLAMSRGRHIQVQTRTAPRLRQDEDGAPTDDLVVRRDESRRVRKALAGLPAIDREVLLLAAAGYTGPEIAIELGRSQVATRTLLCRARGRLRVRLAEMEQAGPMEQPVPFRQPGLVERPAAC